jgi:ankyrin repeat protein
VSVRSVVSNVADDDSGANRASKPVSFASLVVNVFDADATLNSAVISPNVPDEYTYTPMFGSRSLVIYPHSVGAETPPDRHAAASYGHLDVLEYLISQGHTLICNFIVPNSRIYNHFFQTGGDVNVTDGDGETPLYGVENIETARFLVQHGARVDIVNNEGVSVRYHALL